MANKIRHNLKMLSDQQPPFVLYRQDKSRINCLWFRIACLRARQNLLVTWHDSIAHLQAWETQAINETAGDSSLPWNAIRQHSRCRLRAVHMVRCLLIVQDFLKSANATVCKCPLHREFQMGHVYLLVTFVHAKLNSFCRLSYLQIPLWKFCWCSGLHVTTKN